MGSLKMSLVVVGTNHKHSSVALREKLSFSKNRIKDALLLLKERDVLNGAVVLSTCNRVEIYASANDSEIAIREIENFISRYHELEKEEISPYLYICTEKQAMKHLLSVTSGLDSLILGETQILTQVKSSFLESEQIGFMDNFLKEIFNCALYFAKSIHRETKISEGKVSVGSVAIDFIREKLGSLQGKNILIVGTGKVTELVFKYLEKEAPNVVFISNRTFQRANELASQIGAKAVRFDYLKQFLNRADIVITATRSPHFIIKRELLDENLKHRILILDLAMPRDVDPQIKEIGNIDLFYLEDLGSVIEKNREKKAQEVEKVTNILEEEAEKLWAKLLGSQQEAVLLH